MTSPYSQIPTIETSSRKRTSPTSTVPPLSLKTSAVMIPINISDVGPRFIKFIGRGPEWSEDVEPGIILKPRSEDYFPKAANPDEVIDVLDAIETEDPFTLETFESLVKMHFDKGKDFIVARVTTRDPNDESKFYYSYYAAHHINKVLFRTQPEQGLLHRMRAKNPMNNMTIVGDVHYYVIKSASFQVRSTSPEREFPIAKSPSSLTDQIIPSNVAKMLGLHQKKTLHLFMKPEALEESPKLPKSKDLRKQAVSRSDSRRNSADDAYSDPPTPSLRSGKTSLDTDRSSIINVIRNPQVSNKVDLQHRKVRSTSFQNNRDGARTISEWMRLHNHQSNHAPMTRSRTKDLDSPNVTPREQFYEAKYLGSDDDFLMQANIRNYFKEQALESTDAILFSIPVSSRDSSEAFSGASQHPALSNFAFQFGDRPINPKRARWITIGAMLLVAIIIILLAMRVEAKWLAIILFVFLLFYLLVALLFS